MNDIAKQEVVSFVECVLADRVAYEEENADFYAECIEMNSWLDQSRRIYNQLVDHGYSVTLEQVRDMPELLDNLEMDCASGYHYKPTNDALVVDAIPLDEIEEQLTLSDLEVEFGVERDELVELLDDEFSGTVYRDTVLVYQATDICWYGLLNIGDIVEKLGLSKAQGY